MAEPQELVATEPDFVNLKRYDFSLARVCARYPEGAPDKLIVKALCLDNEEQVEELYQSAVRNLRELLED